MAWNCSRSRTTSAADSEPGGTVTGKLERLAVVAEVGASLHAPVGEGHAVAGQARLPLRHEIGEERLEGRGREPVQT
jgi:hypothetical protein